MNVLETERLVLRWLTVEDAPFILCLLNEPSWLRFIGDRGVRTLEDARGYILNGPVAMYARLGFGLYLTELKEGGIPIGLCGLLKRDTLEEVDIGFALLPAFWGQGYAHEAAAAVLAYGKHVLRLRRIVAITSPDNDASGRLLEKLGLRFERLLPFSDKEDVKLFVSDSWRETESTPPVNPRAPLSESPRPLTVETSTPPNTPDPIGPYSHIAKVGPFISIGGTAGVDPATGELAGADAYAQAKQILHSFQVMLESVGSDLNHVLHVNIFLKEMTDFAGLNRAYVEVMGAHRPARTVIGVSELPKAGALLTMNLTAVTRDSGAAPLL